MRAFTLVETIMTVAITAFMMLTLAYLVQYFYKTSAYTLEQSQAINSARRSIENAMRDLREASYGIDGSYPLLSAATSSVTFFADLDSDGTVDRVRYYLSGSTLYRGVTTPTGAPLSYSGAQERTTLVVDNIRNDAGTALFIYNDLNGLTLADPIDIAKVASVHIHVLTDVNPNRAPNVYGLTGSATLRNLQVTD